MKNNKKDSVCLHVSDTIKAGAGLSDLGVTKFISENSDEVIKDLISLGVKFDKNEKDDYFLALEAAHSVKEFFIPAEMQRAKELKMRFAKKQLKIIILKFMKNQWSLNFLLIPKMSVKDL